MQDKYIFVSGLEHVFTLVLRVVRNDMEAKEEVPSRLEPYALGRMEPPYLSCPRLVLY